MRDALIASAENDERSDWTIIATHFERADRPADAAMAWREAAEDARRRGLVAEARLRLGAALDQVALLPAGQERNQLEVELRLQRGYLASSAEGMSSPDATLDYDRCLELTLDIPHAPNMVSTLTAMWGYYISRADLAQARQVSTTLQSLVSEDWGVFWRPQNVASFAMLDWFEGEFRPRRPATAGGHRFAVRTETFDKEAVAAWYLADASDRGDAHAPCYRSVHGRRHSRRRRTRSAGDRDVRRPAIPTGPVDARRTCDGCWHGCSWSKGIMTVRLPYSTRFRSSASTTASTAGL